MVKKIIKNQKIVLYSSYYDKYDKNPQLEEIRNMKDKSLILKNIR